MRHNKAFTLIELTIVLTIISFIVAAIISSDNIIKSSQIISVISDVTRYKNAVKLFEQRYGALPGDIKASTIWSGANDGNEDTRIGNGTGNIADISGEATYAWQHLILASLVSFSSNSSFPVSKIDGAYFLLYDQNPSESLYMYNRAGTFLGLGGIISSLPWYSAINRVTATTIDVKIDDGLPSSGMVYSVRGDDNDQNCSGNNCKCVGDYYTNVYSTNYVFGDETNSCRMIFWLYEEQLSTPNSTGPIIQPGTNTGS